MANRLDALLAREYESGGEKKTAFTKIGAAFEMRNGGGWSVVLDAMPAPVEGQFRILLMVPKPREEQQSRRTVEPDRDDPRTTSRDLDDEIPF